MSIDRRRSPLVTHGKYTPRPSEIRCQRAASMFTRWAGGASYDVIAQAEGVTVDTVRSIIRIHVRELWQAHRRWKLAEIRCHAMAMELRLLRVGKECPVDQPIETLEPPKFWLTAFHEAGIRTVNQLRAVDSEILLSQWRFPIGAVDWAIMKLDKVGLSHVLERPKTRTPSRPIGKHITR